MRLEVKNWRIFFVHTVSFERERERGVCVCVREREREGGRGGHLCRWLCLFAWILGLPEQAVG